MKIFSRTNPLANERLIEVVRVQRLLTWREYLNVSEILQTVDNREFPAPILHIPNRNNGIMEWWNNEIKRWGKVNYCSPGFPSFIASQLPSFRRRRISARRAPTHYSNIPTFHHSNCERSELSSNLK